MYYCSDEQRVDSRGSCTPPTPLLDSLPTSLLRCETSVEEAGVGSDNALPPLFFALQDNRRTPLSGAHVIYVLLIDPGSQATAHVLCAPFNLNHLSQML